MRGAPHKGFSARANQRQHPKGWNAVFAVVVFFISTVVVAAAPIDSADIHIIDGDTIRVYHQRPDVRLVGFNAPETRRAACEG